MSYTLTYIKSRLNASIKNKIDMLVSSDDTINAGVREAFSEMAFRSSKRTVQVSPYLFSDIYSYPAPQDLNGQMVTDIRPNNQADASGKELILRTPEEFYRNFETFNFSVDDSNAYTKLLISLPIDDSTLTVSELDSITGWSAFDVSTSNVRLDTQNYMKGSSSIAFDINAVSGTTAGIVSSTITSFNFTDYLYGSCFVWAFIKDSTNITNYKIRVGSDSSNYYEVTTTTSHEGIPFQNGWNLLRFDMSSKVATGTPITTAGDYIALFMTKDVTKVSETGYAFDHIIFKTGKAYVISYYSSYPWKNTSGTYLAEATAETDYLTCTSDEFEIILNKIISIAAGEIGEEGIETNASKKYGAKRELYATSTPDESKLLMSTYYVFE